MNGGRVDGGIAGEAKAAEEAHNAKEDVPKALRDAAEGIAREVTSGGSWVDLVVLLMAFASAILAMATRSAGRIARALLSSSETALEDHGKRIAALEHHLRRPTSMRDLASAEEGRGHDSSARADGPLPLAERALANRVLSEDEQRWLALLPQYKAGNVHFMSSQEKRWLVMLDTLSRDEAEWLEDTYLDLVRARSTSPEARAELHAEVPPVPLGDTPEEITEARDWFQSWYAPDLESEASMMAKCALTGTQARVMGEHYREVAGACFARAAELDQAQGRGSWAHAWTPEQVKPVLRVVAWFIYLCTPQEQSAGPRCLQHGSIFGPEDFGGSDFEPYRPPPCACPPPRLPDAAPFPPGPTNAPPRRDVTEHDAWERFS